MKERDWIKAAEEKKDGREKIDLRKKIRSGRSDLFRSCAL